MQCLHGPTSLLPSAPVRPPPLTSFRAIGKSDTKLQRSASQQLSAQTKGGAANNAQADARPLDPELAQMFQEAQQNIMRLNKSRLNALAEVKSARERIVDLEARLAQAANGASAHSAPAQQAVTQSEPNSFSGASSPPQSAPAQPQITIAYGTGWERAYLHYRTQNQDWTKTPGIEMRQGQGELDGSKVVTVTGSWVEFVLNNGGDQWDSPDPYGGKKNYVIDTPGTYRLKSGKLQKLA